MSNEVDEFPDDEFPDDKVAKTTISDSDIEQNKNKPYDDISGRAAISFASSPEEAVVYLNRYHTGLSDADLKAGKQGRVFASTGQLTNRLVYKEPGDKKWNYVDPASIGGVKEAIADTAEFAGDVLPAALGTLGAIIGVASTAPTAIATGPVGPTLGGVAGAGIGSGAGTAANRLIARGIGVNQELDLADAGDVALSTALGGAAEGAAPYVGSAIKTGAKAVGKQLKAPIQAGKNAIQGAKDLMAPAIAGPGLPMGPITQNVKSLAKGKSLPVDTGFYGDDEFRKQMSDLIDTFTTNPKQFEQKFFELTRQYGFKPEQTQELLEELASGIQINQKVKSIATKTADKLTPEMIPSSEKYLGEVYPQGVALRGKNINRLQEAFDLVDDSLVTPMEEAKAKITKELTENAAGKLSPEQIEARVAYLTEELPPKGAQYAELQQALKRQFEIDYSDIKDRFRIDYGEIEPVLEAVPLSQQIKDSLKAEALDISNKSGSPAVEKKAGKFIEAVDTLTNLKQLNELKRNYSHLFRDADDVVDGQVNRLYKLIDPAIEFGADGAGVDEGVIKSLSDTNKMYYIFKESFDKVANLIESGNTKEGIVMLEQLLLGKNKLLTALKEEGAGKYATEHFTSTIRLAMRTLLAEMKEKAIAGEKVKADSLWSLANKAKGMPELRQMMEFMAKEIENFGTKHMGQAVGAMEGIERGLKAGGNQFGYESVKEPSKFGFKRAALSLLPAGPIPATIGEVKSSIYSPAPALRRVVELMRKQQNPIQQDVLEKPPMNINDFAVKLQESKLSQKLKEALSKAK